MTVTTIEEALDFVQDQGICTLFSSKDRKITSLWEAVDLPENDGRTKWGQRVEAIWAWKNELPACYPDLVFYGKIRGGVAALMSMDYLRETHYPTHHLPVDHCPPLARDVYEIVRLNPCETAELRCEAMESCHCSKSQFDTALKKLQITLNIARTNEPDVENDLWLPFLELYPDFE
ncbi:hypothetical protein [Pelagicoccus sp. SDUM812003]|uniref:AlkZ-related protein n=1 Tax=Pelagicoccus sp. SDUM812003 TaxID=3041267 RepID=UPI00280CDE13|nr:hypothetical protein [Pelagicoccus sp. SDUM812003]MDQ8201874.1 hypothetical protein [Pelagicoccus sp. SDUM812003]